MRFARFANERTKELVKEQCLHHDWTPGAIGVENTLLQQVFWGLELDEANFDQVWGEEVWLAPFRSEKKIQVLMARQLARPRDPLDLDDLRERQLLHQEYALGDVPFEELQSHARDAITYELECHCATCALPLSRPHGHLHEHNASVNCTLPYLTWVELEKGATRGPPATINVRRIPITKRNYFNVKGPKSTQTALLKRVYLGLDSNCELDN